MTQHCDRCPLVGPTEKVLGFDLCPVCVYDMQQIVSAAIKKGRKDDKPLNTRVGLGENLDLVKKIVQEKGFVDSETFAEATGKTKRDALGYLCGTAKRGVLVNIGRGKYTLPKGPDQSPSA